MSAPRDLAAAQAHEWEAVASGRQEAIDALEVENAGLREDADKWRAAEAEGHVVDFSKTGYGLQHPPSCRPNLIGCRFNRFLAKQRGPLRAPGRWRMQWTGKEPTFEAVS